MEAFRSALRCGVDDQRGRAEEGKNPKRAAPERGEEQQAGPGERFELSRSHAHGASKLRARLTGEAAEQGRYLPAAWSCFNVKT